MTASVALRVTPSTRPGTALAVVPPSRRPGIGWIPPLLAAVLTSVYCLISLTRFARFDTPSWDNAIFEQAVAGYAHLGAPIIDIKGPGFNQLGDHFSPILALVAPAYRLLPHAQTLLVAQAVLVGLSAIPIGRAAIRHLGTGSGAAVAVAYGLSFGLQAAINVDFHEVAFAAPLLAAAGNAGLRHRWRAAALWCLPLLFVKEDLGLTVAAIGVVAFLAGARRIGAALAIVGVAATVVTVLVVIPAFSPTKEFGYWSLIGADGMPGPWHNALAGWDLKATTLLATFGVTAFLALRSPWALAAIPTLAWRFVGNRTSFWGTGWQYSLVLMPIVFVAAIDGLRRIRECDGDHRVARLLRSATPAAPVVILGIAVIASAWLPVRGLVDGHAFRPNPRADTARQVMSLVPPGSSVETNRGLITHLTTDHRVYWVGTVGAVVPDFVLIDLRTGGESDIVGFAEEQHPGFDYRLRFRHDGYRLAELVGPSTTG